MKELYIEFLGILDRVSWVYKNDLFKLMLFLLFILFSFTVIRKFFLKLFERFVSEKKDKWNEILFSHKILNRVSYFIPAIIFHWCVDWLFADGLFLSFGDTAASKLKILLACYLLIIGLLVVDGIINAFLDIYEKYEVSKRVPIKGYVQVLKILLYVICCILVVSALLDKSPTLFLGGLSALTAVLLLIFKNSILSLVANIQITTNGLIRVGDWIEMPKYGADGFVIEITLNTLKVQNWDKTFSFVPMHVLLDESYKNWRGMFSSGGRRVKRSINIDLTSVKFCDEQMLESYRKFQILRPYLDEKINEIKEFNESNHVDYSSVINGRRMTNLGTFRAYVKTYLQNHPKVNLDMIFLIRQLDSTDKGMPLEIYVFINDVRWVQYEEAQADIFDHLFASVKEFDLRIYQSPSSSDVEKLALR